MCYTVHNDLRTESEAPAVASWAEIRYNEQWDNEL